MGRKAHDLSGQKCGKLKVIERNGSDKYSKPLWFCKCDCGKECTILGRRLVSGKTKSCGCITTATHGLSKHPLWGVWNQMIQRCHNPNTRDYKSYGSKGIEVCGLWRNSSSEFLKWALPQWEKGLSIDRIDDRIGYKPENCRFIPLRDNVLKKSVTGRNIGKVFGTWRITSRVPESVNVTVACVKCKRPDEFSQGNVTQLTCRQCKCM